MERLLHRVRGRIERGERITAEDCRELFGVDDFLALAGIARIARERRYGRRGYFRAVELLYYHGEDPTLFMAEAATIVPPETVELVLRSPEIGDADLPRWLDRFERFAAGSIPTSLSLTATFLSALADAGGISVGELFDMIAERIALRLSAVDAFLLVEGWREENRPGVITSERWLAAHKAAHEKGMRTEAGMVFMNDWDPALYVEHLSLIRDLADATGGFESFIPMAWHDPNADVAYRSVPTAAMAMKATAICRLFLDNIPHILVSPDLTDPELATAAFDYGADTIDPTVRRADLRHGERRGAHADLLDATGGLTVVSDNERIMATSCRLDIIEEHIAEARYEPVALDGALRTMRMENKL